MADQFLYNFTTTVAPTNASCDPNALNPATKSEFEFTNGVVCAFVFSIITIVGLIGNLLVIIVVVSNKQMRNTTNILIISLASADLSFITICVPTTAIAMNLTVYPFGQVWCMISQYMTFVTAYVSIYTLVLMSFDRYLAVVHAIAAMNHRTERNAVIAVLIVWAVLLVANSPVFFFYKVVHYTHECQARAQCVFVGELATQINYYMFFLFGYVIPLLLVVVLYGLMVYRLLYSVPRGHNQSSEAIRSKRRVTRMVVVVIVIFALCWLPNQALFIYLRIYPHPGTRAFVVILNISRILAYTNSCVNPILYAFLSENFRKGFRKILCMGQGARSPMDMERTNTRPLLNTSGKKENLKMDESTLATRTTNATSVNGL